MTVDETLLRFVACLATHRDAAELKDKWARTVTDTEEVLGFLTVDGERTPPATLSDRAAIEAFLESHLFDEEVVITTGSDALVFRSVDGVDVYSRLHEFGVDLASVFRRVRAAAVKATNATGAERQSWEDLYDSIGLSPGEVAMRQRVKALAKAAATVGDVVELLAGTYFDASFESVDGMRLWGEFDLHDLSVVEKHVDGVGASRVRLSPESRVRHVGSGEDRHSFVLLDPPSERRTTSR